MGLRSWTSASPPSPMACLQVETPPICRGKFKTVLQLCLQQRRTREQLVEQGIIPSLKGPAVFHERIRSLERARTGTFLKHKLCSRPERSELVRMHILQETQADSSLQAAQLRLKRARLADSLNEKISQRPGPMELVQKNILPVQSEDEEAGNELGVKTPDVYSFDEDSCSSPRSQKSDSSGSSRESGDKDSAQSSPRDSHNQSSPKPQSTVEETQSSEKQIDCPATSPPALVQPVTPGPVLVKQSLTRATGEKSRGKKSREPKPRVKKLKYHQYVPPHQKQEQDVPMDSAYARLLQQQQQFLHLQILSQQQLYHATQPATRKQTSEAQGGCGSEASLNLPPNPSNHRAELPANLEDMKVAELKMELKLRSLPVSGTKIDLIERLRSHHDKRAETLSAPVSPITTKVSHLGLKDSVPSEAQDGAAEDLPPGDRDKRLFEKERQIEELMRKLEQEQRLVEELKMQLEVEKRFQQGDSPPPPPPPASCPALVRVKEELVTPSDCSFNMCPVPPSGVKQEVTGIGRVANPVLMSMTLLHPGTSPPPGPDTAHVSAQAPLQSTAPKAWTDATVLTFSSRQTSADKVHGEASSLLLQHKSRDPPRYEEAVKQTRGLSAQCPSVSSQQMDDLFDVLIETGEILPFVKAEPGSPEQRLPVTASVTTLPVNTALRRPPAVVQVAQPPAPKPAGAPLAPPHGAHMEFEENTPGSHVQGEDSMDWLDLTDMSATVSIFSSDFLDSNEMHLNWE